jgi:acetolactate synthase-1/2/3 large subunit
MGQTETLQKSSTSKTTKKMRVSGSEAVILSLLEEGVDTIFGYPGGAIMPIYDALYHYQDKVKHLLVRHEQGAAHAAQGYARVTGEVGVCFATSGPGATNLITGIADAQIDSTPIVCITGQVPAHLLGTDAFQESDVLGISMPVTKWNFQVTKPEEIPAAIARAFYIAKTGRRDQSCWTSLKTPNLVSLILNTRLVRKSEAIILTRLSISKISPMRQK